MVAAVICVLVVLAAVVVVIYGGRDSGKGLETESAGILSAAENTDDPICYSSLREKIQKGNAQKHINNSPAT